MDRKAKANYNEGFIDGYMYEREEPGSYEISVLELMDLTETYPTGYRSGQNNGSDYYYQREGQRELHRRMHQFGQVQGQEYYKERNLALTPENTKKVKQALVQYRPVQRSSDKETKEKNHEQGMDI